MKKNKCELCGWKGRIHLHHIIPISNFGLDESENIVELCPNHHAKATEDEEQFAEKFNLIGKRKSEEELNDLLEFSFLWIKATWGENIDYERLKYLMDKYQFDKIDAISYFMGITRNSLLNNYLGIR